MGLNNPQNLPKPTSEICVAQGTGTGFGSTNTNVRTFVSTPVTSTGTDITYTSSSTLGDSFSINTTGVYSISYSDGGSGTAGFIGITRNSTALSSGPGSVSIAQGKIAISATTAISTAVYTAACTLNCTAGQTIRAQADTAAVTNGVDNVIFRITRIA